MADTWDGADPYERFMGRWSRVVARDFIGWLAAPSGAVWLDVGCGTGALSSEIATNASPGRIEGVDLSSAFLDQAAARLVGPRFAFRVGDAMELPQTDHSFDVTVAALMLNFLPTPARGVSEMARVTKPGGIVATYLWDYGGAMQMLRYFWDAAADLDAGARDLDEGVRFPLARRDPLEALWSEAGLSAVETRALDMVMRFADFADYWEPFLGGQGPAPGYVASLSSSDQEELRALLADRLPASADGSIELEARAWAVKGLLPA